MGEKGEWREGEEGGKTEIKGRERGKWGEVEGGLARCFGVGL